MNDSRLSIWQLQTRGDTSALIIALQHEAMQTRMQAAAALRVLGAVEAIPALRLAHHRATDATEREQLHQVLDSLIYEQRTRGPLVSAVVRKLVSQLENGSYLEIRQAAGVLGKMRDKTAADALLATFNNQRLPASIRLCAADALLEIDAAPAILTLLAGLRNANWQARQQSALILGQLSADWAVERLAESLRDPHLQVRQAAAIALQHINTPEAQALLATARRSLPAPSLQWPRRPQNPTTDRAATQEMPVIPPDDAQT